jgi:uncharacterized membrane protein
VALLACLTALALVVPSRHGLLSRWRGAVLLVVAVGSIVATVAFS